jgi:hypothetical protein
MPIPLFRKVDGKKFMWDGAAYASLEEASQVMAAYASQGFEVRLFENNGQFLLYSRRAPGTQPGG